jgi:hypothetical protein
LPHRLSAPSNEAPNDQYDYRAHNRSNEAALVCAVPADRLPQISRDNAPTIPRIGEDEARRLLSPGVINFAITPATNPMTIVQMILASISQRHEAKRAEST